MSEIAKLLERQAAWQKSRRDWSWAEKVRLAERIRESIAIWSSGRRKGDERPSESGEDSPYR